MKLSEAGREHIVDLNIKLASEHMVRGVAYDNIQLNGGGCTELVMTNGSKPTMEADAYIGYWPGGFPDGQSFTMIVADDPVEYIRPDQATMLHGQIGKLAVSPLAQQRFRRRDDQRPEVRAMRAKQGHRLLPRVITACEDAGNPLVLLTIGHWRLPAGSDRLFGAIMHFPAGVLPGTALANLKGHAELPIDSI